MNKKQAKPTAHFSVIHLVLASGERLPCLVNTETWIPVRVATRWAVRFRRLRTQSSTLADNLHILCHVYSWAKTIGGFELDDYLVAGNLLTVRQIESLATFLQKREYLAEEQKGWQYEAIDAGVYNHRLSIVKDFLVWSLDSGHRGGASTLSLEQLSTARSHLEDLFITFYIGVRPSQRIEPLEDDEIQAIRRAIGPKQSTDGKWTFPEKIFSEHTKLRNWLMFETALQLGLRRGELLKLRLDSVPRGCDDAIVVKRFADDPHDSRMREPAVKTAERAIPAPDNLLKAFRVYFTSPPPLGRVRGKGPYLFTTRYGSPISLDRADDIIQDISRYSGVFPLSWHRLRHTWAEKLANELYEEQNGMEQLAWLGGWTNLHSSDRYIQRAKQHHATEKLRAYQKELYDEGSSNGNIAK